MVLKAIGTTKYEEAQRFSRLELGNVDYWDFSGGQCVSPNVPVRLTCQRAAPKPCGAGESDTQAIQRVSLGGPAPPTPRHRRHRRPPTPAKGAACWTRGCDVKKGSRSQRKKPVPNTTADLTKPFQAFRRLPSVSWEEGRGASSMHCKHTCRSWYTLGFSLTHISQPCIVPFILSSAKKLKGSWTLNPRHRTQDA